MKKIPLIFILVFGLVGILSAQRVLLRMCWNLNECPTNYPVQVQDAGTNLAVLPGFDSNWTSVAYSAARPGFDTIWTNWLATNQLSTTFSARTNLSGLLLRQTLLLSNVNWFATNMSVLNATLGASNLVLLRYVEERIKAGQ